MQSNSQNVLIADEDDSFLDMAAITLESLGLSVIKARDGDEALAILQSCTSIAVLLTEIVLPGGVGGGSELARLAKEANPGISIIYTTRYSPMLLLDSEAPRDGRLLRKVRDRNELKSALSAMVERAPMAG